MIFILEVGETLHFYTSIVFGRSKVNEAGVP